VLRWAGLVLTADRRKQRGFEEGSKGNEGQRGLAFRDGPSTKSRLILLRWAGLVFDGGQK
jgi:hypothetical protein